MEQKRAAQDQLRGQYQQTQRQQFDAEKRVAVADTSVQNLQRTLQQLESERVQRASQIEQLETERIEKEKHSLFEKPIWNSCNSIKIIRRSRSCRHKLSWMVCATNWQKKAASWMLKRMNTRFLKV